MIRFGVYTIDQLLKNKVKDRFGKDRNISIYLYKLLQEQGGDAGEKLSEVVLNRFNSNNNAIKRTYRNRCNEFDEACMSVIRIENPKNISVHDMAVSDGRASVYFLKLLNENFTGFSYHASDLEVGYYRLNGENTKDYVVVDENKKIIEITAPPFVWNYARKEGNFYFLNNLLRKMAKEKFESLVQTAVLDEEENKILLADFEFLNLINTNKNFRLFNHNLFQQSASTYSIIRVMNILHYGYFDAPTITRILDNIHRALDQNGLLIEGSNEDAGSPVSGGIYRKTESGFDLIRYPQNPSRIGELILNHKHA